jgi:hypothetical protein
MDPVSLILQALVTGATKVAGDSVQDAYKGLKNLIQRKFAGKSGAENVLAKHEEKPEDWKEPLKEELVAVGADKDEEIINKAQELMKLANPQEAAQGKYNIKAEQIKGIVGDISGGDINQTIN